MSRVWNLKLGKLVRMMPALFLRDPLFRYATIAAVIALLFLIAQFAQSLVGPPPIPAVPAKPQSSSAPPAAAGGNLATPLPAEAPAIAPGRPLTGIAVDPAPADTFGKLPKGAKPQ